MDFLRNNRRFSFKLAGKDSWEIGYSSETTVNGNEITVVYDFDGGIRVTNVAKKYDEYGSYEWVNYIENPTDKPSEIISELWDCDCTLPLKHEENPKLSAYCPDEKIATKVYAPTGSTWDREEFGCHIDKIHENRKIHHIYPNETKEYCASGGRSSEERAPFFNVHKEGEGYIFAIGWTGQWQCRIGRTNDGISFRSKIEDAFFQADAGREDQDVIGGYHALSVRRCRIAQQVEAAA